MSFLTAGASQPPGSDRPAKVAIPRLNRQPHHEPPPKTPAAKRPRVSMACRSCRIRKVRCNGGKPTCSNCQENSEPCAYDDTRRNRLKIATDQIEEMEALLQDIRVRATDQDRQKIDSVLAQILDENVTMRESMESLQSFQQDETYEKNSIHAQLGPIEDVDVVEDDLVQERESQAPGFVGKGSELQWLRRLRLKAGHIGEASVEHQSPYSDSSANAETSLQNTQRRERHQHHGSSNRTNTNLSSFHLDDNDLHPDLSVQAFDLPSRQTAERLLNCYLTTVQATFPILAEPPFKYQFEQLYASPPYPSNATSKWLGLLNLVFAIGRRHLDLTEEARPPDDQDHCVYWSRAQILGLEGFHAVGHADITQIQTNGLLALYLLSIGHVNRAWVVMGSSLRLAHALGLHVRNESRTSTAAQKEVWLRMWWGVYSLEGHLSTIVGRPSFVNESYCSAPLPLPLSTDQLSDEGLVQNLHQRHRRPAFRPNEPHKDMEAAERSNAGSYLKSMIELSIMTQKVMTELYSTAAVINPWRRTQQVVTSLCDELEDWLAALPTDLNFSLQVDHVSTRLERERLILYMQYISTKILITRPCVCRFGSHERGESENFNKQTARACVRAAKELTTLLPLHLHVSYLYKIGPWWSVVNSLMQALIVLLLEMSYGTVHFPEDGEEIIVSTKKLIRSLRTMGKTNTVAERAYTIAFQVLRGLALKLNAEISDLVWEDIAHSTAPSLDAQVPNMDSSQWYPLPTMEDGQVPGVRDAPDIWANFYDDQTRYMSMFYTPTTQPLSNAPMAGHYFQTYQPYDSISNNPFMTTFDEDNPVTSGERM